jgi:hypothetical protein
MFCSTFLGGGGGVPVSIFASIRRAEAENDASRLEGGGGCSFSMLLYDSTICLPLDKWNYSTKVGYRTNFGINRAWVALQKKKNTYGSTISYHSINRA